MEIGSCIVRLAGDLQNTVKKNKVTPAEVLVLRHMHGADSVINVTVLDKKEWPRDSSGKTIMRTSRQEMDRLIKDYVDRFAPGGDRPNIIRELFPGANPTLPKTFAEVELVAKSEEEDPDPELVEQRRNAAAAAPPAPATPTGISFPQRD